MNENMKVMLVCGLVLIIIGGLIGYFLGVSKINQAELGILSNSEADLQNCQSELERYKKAIDFAFPSPEEVFFVGGEIKFIENNIIVVETASLDEMILPGEEQKLEEIRVNVGSNTKIIKFSFPDFSELKEGDMLPEPKETSAKLSDLKPGDIITAESDKNIKSRKEFTASRIIISS